MTGPDFDTARVDAALADWLAPPARTPDRMFAARVDTAISDLALLHKAERRYARGFFGELLALAAVALAGVILVRWPGAAMDGAMVAVPVALLMLVLLSPARQPTAGSSPAP